MKTKEEKVLRSLMELANADNDFIKGYMVGMAEATVQQKELKEKKESGDERICKEL